MKGDKMEHAAFYVNDGYCDARSHEQTSAPGRLLPQVALAEQSFG
jgi:hypothetical protein